MLIYDALKKDHVKVLELCDRLIGSADADDATRSTLIQQIRDELVPHARAEEAVFYNSLRSIDETKGLVMHGYQEHMMAETLLRSLQATDKVGIDWQQGARKLREALAHHIEEEEGEIFTAAQQVLANEEAEMMGKAFEQMKPEVREDGFMQNTLDMIANVMPQRFVAPLRSFVNKT